MLNYLTGYGGLRNDFRRLEEDLDQLLGNGGRPTGIRSANRGTYPPINIGATADQVDVYVYAAGIDPANTNITLQSNLLTIEGERKTAEVEKARYYRKERTSGSFRRVVTLPEDVDPDRIVARYSDGVLQITVSRREANRPRQIKVH